MPLALLPTSIKYILAVFFSQFLVFEYKSLIMRDSGLDLTKNHKNIHSCDILALKRKYEFRKLVSIS